MAKKISNNDLIKTYQKNGQNQHKTAKALKVSQPAVNQALKRPEVQKTLAQINEDALKEAGAHLAKVYQRAAEGLDAYKVIPGMKLTLGGDKPEEEGIRAVQSTAPDFKERRESVKLCLQLVQRLDQKDQDESLGIQNIFNFFIPSKEPIRNIIDMEENVK